MGKKLVLDNKVRQRAGTTINTKYVYNEDGKILNKLEYTDKYTRLAVYRYNEDNKLVSYKDSKGLEYKVYYNSSGDIDRIEYEGGAIEEYIYDDNCNLISVIDNVGNESISEYDENNNEIYYKSQDGIEVWYKYDENNNCIETHNSVGRKMILKYNKDNELVEYINNDVVYNVFNGICDNSMYFNKSADMSWISDTESYRYTYIQSVDYNEKTYIGYDKYDNIVRKIVSKLNGTIDDTTYKYTELATA